MIILKEIQDKSQDFNHNQSFISKRSNDLAVNVMKRRISGTVHRFSQNGYISFCNYLRVLYYLKVTEICGNKKIEKQFIQLNNIDIGLFTSVEKKGIEMRKERRKKEYELAKQLWSKINKFLFNFIDSIILIDILINLFMNNTKKGVEDFDNYIHDITNMIEISPEEIGRNLKRNKSLEVDEPWSSAKIFNEFRKI